MRRRARPDRNITRATAPDRPAFAAAPRLGCRRVRPRRGAPDRDRGDRGGRRRRLLSLPSRRVRARRPARRRSEEHTSELQSLAYLVCRLLLEKKKKKQDYKQSEKKKKQRV